MLWCRMEKMWETSPSDCRTHEYAACKGDTEAFGCHGTESQGNGSIRGLYPFTTLSFMALPVIPELRLTDKGLVDVKNFQMIKEKGE